MQIQSEKSKNALRDVVFDANIEVDKALKPFADNIPLPPESERTEFDVDVFERARSLALSWVRARWYSYTGQLDWAKQFQEDYDRRLESLIGVFKARRGTRTKRVVVNTSPRTNRLYSQAKRY